MKKRALTLIEIMIVVLLITLITGVIGYNMKGSLDKGRKFKTERAKEKLNDLLMICVEDGGEDPETVAKNPTYYLEKSGLARDPKALVLDGWNKPFKIEYDKTDRVFKITSDNDSK